MSINELAKKRISHVESCRLNGDNSHRIIANLYSDSTHFLYELLQNAQDAEATTILFELYQDRLVGSHNGRAFSFADVEAISTIGSSTKSNEPNKIGKFGAGFKSVFSITDTPHIYGETYNFKISNYIIPEFIEPLENRGREYTTTILPFDRAETDAKSLYDSIAKRLRSIGKDELIFLSNLSRIDWKIGDEAGYVEKTVEKNGDAHSEICIKTQDKSEYFELYTHGFCIEDKALECKIAFATNEGKYISVSASPLYVFFPTVVATNLRFLVHAPYKTTPNRETINFADHQNQTITENITVLYKNILIDLARRKALDAEVLLLLPLSSQSGEIAQKLFNASRELFKTHPLIPAQEGGYALPDDVFAVANGVNASLFEEVGVNKLFQKSAWLHGSLLESKYNTVRYFLIAYVGMKEYGLYEIIQRFDEGFLGAQSNGWMALFYGECARINVNLSTLPLARLEDGAHIAFKSASGNLQVYLHPQTRTRFRCIHPDISASDVAKPLFNAIGIKMPDVIDEIKEFIIPSITKLESMEGYFDAFAALLPMYDTASEPNQTRIVDLIKNTVCILCVNDGVNKLKTSKEVYLPTEQLKRWFAANPAVLMMDDRLWAILSETKLVSLLLFKTRPTLLPIPPHIDSNHKDRLRHSDLVVDRGGDDFELEGLERLLAMSIDKELSLIIWGFLVSHLANKNILRGYYRWQGAENKSHEKDFDSKICALLNRTEWLFDENGEAHKPIELKPEELDEEYEYDVLGVDIKRDLSLLSFKSSEIERLEKQGFTVIAPDMAEKFEKWLKQNSEAKDEVSWEQASPDIASLVIEVEANTIEVCTNAATFRPRKSKDLRHQTSYNFFENEYDEERPVPVVPREIRKAIGEWSEEYVYRYLQDFCEKHKDQNYSIRRMNDGGKVGHGYDFVLMRDSEELRYIEVKGRAADTNEFEITKTQWGFAKFLYDRGEGDKYSIFVVTNAGKASASLITINSPVKMWLDGDVEMIEVKLSYA